MSINKIIITKGIFQNKELKLLVSFDEKDCPVDLINLDYSKVGEIHKASVQKVLNDIQACIIKLDSNEKGFIEFKKLKPDFFITRHSNKKIVCQGDEFYVQISQDKKSVKPVSCNFVEKAPDKYKDCDVINFYIQKHIIDAPVIVTDLIEIKENIEGIDFYYDDFSLWSLYNLTTLLNRVTSKIVHLKSGSNIIIEYTESMTVIDVNSSKNYGKHSALDINVEALNEIFKQIRLRSISGIILVDLLKVSKEDEKKILEHAKKMVSLDYSLVEIHGFSNLGLLEITRSRMYATFEISE